MVRTIKLHKLPSKMHLVSDHFPHGDFNSAARCVLGKSGKYDEET